MDLKPKMILTIEKGERKYEFHMSVGSPFGEAYDAAFQVLKDILELSNQATDAMVNAPKKKE